MGQSVTVGFCPLKHPKMGDIRQKYVIMYYQYIYMYTVFNKCFIVFALPIITIYAQMETLYTYDTAYMGFVYFFCFLIQAYVCDSRVLFTADSQLCSTPPL